MQGVTGKDLPALIDEMKAAMGSGAVLLIADAGGKAAVATGVTADLTDKVSAVDILRAAVPALVARAAVAVLTWRKAVGRLQTTPTKPLQMQNIIWRA